MENYKALTKVKLLDTTTYNLVHGILLINKVHKDTAKLFIGNFNQVTIDISESVYDMSNDDVELLFSWNRNRYYYAEIDQTYWVFKNEL